MTSKELRQKFLDFYRERGHKEIPQAPLVPETDTSVLFTTAGMHPLIPYLLGEEHPDGTRLMNVQRSLRTTDVDEVGDSTHETMFEMLGHWSLGDYWKQEAIEWSFAFVTKVLGFSKDRIAVTIYEGNPESDIPLDTEARDIWEALGVQRIVPLGKDNFWGPVHAAGPCGPTTEIFVYIGEDEPAHDSIPGGPKDHEWVEIWNNVFMEYDKTIEGTYTPLAQRNIDTGVGLDRVLMVVNGLNSVYETDVYQPIIAAVSDDSLAHAQRDIRIVADHIKAAVFLVADGVLPSNKDRGYVLRRLIRRAVQAARRINETVRWDMVVEAVIATYGSEYPYIPDKGELIHQVIETEQQKFSQQLGRATQFLAKALTKSPSPSAVEAAQLAFLAYQSHALPLEFSYELLAEHGVNIGEPAFNDALEALTKKHKAVSAEGAEKKFGGHGLILDNGELRAGNEEELKKVLRLHTATHLLQAALRHVLGNQIQQKGSDINAERLRFDFAHPDKLTDEQKQYVEAWVAEIVARDLPVQFVELPLEEAKQSGALHFFTHKYPEKVKVYFVGASLEKAVSKEFCGGPHVQHTGEVGRVRILKDEAIGAGLRRLKATVQ